MVADQRSFTEYRFRAQPLLANIQNLNKESLRLENDMGLYKATLNLQAAKEPVGQMCNYAEWQIPRTDSRRRRWPSVLAH